MTDSGDGGRFDHQPEERGELPHPPPPSIRITGDVPRGGLSPARSVGATEPLQVPEFRPADPDRDDEPGIDRPASSGSVIDRPAPLPPDWMSGVEVPDLPTTGAADGEWVEAADSRVPGSIQRGVSLALVIILVVVVALVLLGSVTDLGSGLG